MTNNAWQPTDEQMNLEIAPAYEEIRERLRKMQVTTGCPDSYIKVLLEFITTYYSGDPAAWNPLKADQEV